MNGSNDNSVAANESDILKRDDILERDKKLHELAKTARLTDGKSIHSPFEIYCLADFRHVKCGQESMLNTTTKNKTVSEHEYEFLVPFTCLTCAHSVIYIHNRPLKCLRKTRTQRYGYVTLLGRWIEEAVVRLFQVRETQRVMKYANAALEKYNGLAKVSELYKEQPKEAPENMYH